jgi:hypothetical protein
MARCPQCNKNLMDLTPRCPTCQADLGLLLDYVGQLQGGLDRADSLTRAGELGQAVWAYLEVLEVDPDNPTARRQVGQVATAVRQFDVTAPGRRWTLGLSPYLRGTALFGWLGAAVLGVLLLLVFTLGYFLGSLSEPAPPETKPPPSLTGK